MPATINFLGGVALLVSGLTGPSIAVIPQLFQEAGWLTPLMAFGLVTILAGSAALFLVESMAAITGNENFQASIEYSTLAELFFGHRWHWVFQALLYVALQSQAITSLIESFQAMDTLLVTVAHKSCAISFKKGWECVSKVPTDAQGVFNDYIFISFGYLMTFVLVLPLGLIHLTDNIKFQIASFITLLFIVIVWVVTFCQVGIKNYPIPVVASNQGTVVGFVISNFAFVTTIPAFVNNVHPSTNIRRVIWLSLLISCSIYLVIGLTGASAFHTPQNSTILAVISDQRPSVIAVISVYAFPVAVLITSIPVFMIIIRYNLLRGNICSKPWAIFWSSILPWIVVIPFQTNGWLTIIMNWTSLVFSSVANLVIPFVLYLVSKRYKASAALDLHRDHDEFRIRPLETSSMHTPPVSIHHQPHSASSHVHFRASEDIHSSDFVGKLVSPYPAVVETVVPGEDNVIRIVRSPSIHRHYGESTADASGSGGVLRKLSIPKAATVGQRAKEKNEDSKQTASSPLDLVVPHDELSNFLGSDVTHRRRGSHNYVPESDGTKPTPSPYTHRSVPEIRIDTAAAVTTIAREPPRGHSLSAGGDVVPHHRGTLASPLLSSREELRRSMDRRTPSVVSISLLPSPTKVDAEEQSPAAPSLDPQARESPPLLVASPISLSLPIPVAIVSDNPPPSSSSPSASSTTAPHRTFEAFPTLEKFRWFNSTIAAILFCGITSTMVSGTIIYDIVLAARGDSQG